MADEVKVDQEKASPKEESSEQEPQDSAEVESSESQEKQTDSETPPAQEEVKEEAQESSEEPKAEEKAEGQKEQADSEAPPAEEEDELVEEPDEEAKPEEKEEAGEPEGEPKEVKEAEFQQLAKGEKIGEKQNIQVLLDVTLPVSIELGRTNMSIGEILDLGPGSVVELEKLAGEPVEVLVNDKTIARGEVVVVDENFGVRITQLVSKADLIKNL